MREITEHITEVGNLYCSNTYDGFVKDRTLFPYFLILFMISPVLALISGMFSFRQRGAKLIMILFFGVLGYSWIINPGMDSHSIIENFQDRYLVMSFSQFLYETEMLITLKGDDNIANDAYQHFLLYSISMITEQGKWVMFSLASIFGFFYVKNAWMVYKERKEEWDLVSLLLFIFFISWISVIGINAPRNYTGGMVFFFGAYSYLRTGKASYLVLVAMTPLFHFMYFAIAPCFFVYVFLKDRKYLYLGILAVSFVGTLGLAQLDPILTSTELTESRAEIYTGENWEDGPPGTFETNKSFHAQYYREAGEWAITGIFFGVLFLGGYLKDKNHDQLQNGLAGTALLILSFSNFMTAIPALSGRSHIYFGLFALAYLVRFFSSNKIENKKLYWLVYLFLPAILLFLFTQFSRIGDYADFRVLVSPLLYPFIGDDPISMKEFIRTILEL
ncbi:EpsG family protein [Rhodohalobacter barkolensis]|uniref:EpsG family protein n=1 Tax=Rhodohalobacter barkolensis TaxID=2053187 RepID=A0A2N0VGF5_9BACT|nr:EpsG family protein [Rhodohalobacter barkolensis]PKD43267.1 hypothetical protein CWD77_11675 [Rhodohalobacter barkolensis]